jgi:two-component system, NtrC family, response regulator PilR
MCAKRTGGILIVEDNADMRNALVEFLSLEGMHAEAVGTVREGKDKLKGDAKSCDWLITDFDLPDGTGMELLKLVKQHRLHMRVMVMTGRIDSVELKGEVLASGAAIFVNKPFELAWLAKVLRG